MGHFQRRRQRAALAGDGRELFFRFPHSGKLFSVSIETEPAFPAGVPKLLFDGPYDSTLGGDTCCDVARDGQQFTMVQRTADDPPRKFEQHLRLDFFTELERLAPTHR